MANWYCSREQLKRAARITGEDKDPEVDLLIESVSRRIDNWTRRFFIPKTQTRVYRWPPLSVSPGYVVYLDQGLISVTTLKTKAQDTSPTTIAATDYFLEPANTGPPYTWLEIDLASQAALESGTSRQRTVEIVGLWGYQEDTLAVGTVSSGLDSGTTATTMVCSNASLTDVGDTLLIETEQLFVSDRDFAALGSVLLNMAGNLAADMATRTVVLDGSHGVVAREVIRLDSEQMFVVSVATNNLTVIRAWNGSVLASHSDDVAVHINRTLTVERAINGTTAATHADATAISKYEIPFDIKELCLAETIANAHQQGAGWGRSIGTGEAATELDGRELSRMRKEILPRYLLGRVAAI